MPDEQADPASWLRELGPLAAPGERALDLGCAVGADLPALLDLGLEVVGFDRDERLLGHARAQVPGATFVVGDLTEPLPFPDGHFALVVASLSLHYLDRATTRRAVDEIRRVLRPSGALVVRVNRVGDVGSGWGVGQEIEPDLFEVGGAQKRFFDEASLRELLEPGFVLDRLEPGTTNRFGPEKWVLLAPGRREG